MTIRILVIILIVILTKIDIASARTKGLYIESSVINTTVRFKYNKFDQEETIENNTSYGFKLSYAFNYKNLYFAPAIYYDNYSVNTNLQLEDDVKLYGPKSYINGNILNSYGAKLNIGYDATHRFSAFITIGYGNTRESTARYYEKFPDFKTKKNSTLDTYIGGFGLKYSLLRNIDIIASYEVATLSNTSSDPNENRYKKSFDDIIRGDADAFPPDLRVARFAVSYKF